jgi:hypothetical protein
MKKILEEPLKKEKILEENAQERKIQRMKDYSSFHRVLRKKT